MTDTLLITIGESWTWGESLEEKGLDRLKTIFGYHLSNMLNAQWQNIALSGASNAWIAKQYNDCINKTYDYKNVIIVCTLTEVGRDFNVPEFDNNRNYFADLEVTETLQDVQNLQSKWVETQFAKFKYTSLFATNFVDSNYPNLPTLDKSWIDLIGEHIGIKPPTNTYTVNSWAFDKLLTATNFKNYDYEVWIKSVLQEFKKAEALTEWLINSPLNFKVGSKHPTPEAHYLWAEYLYHQIQKTID